jgi:anti-sigma regulatory factor (Ser/Thr protein kinase)
LATSAGEARRLLRDALAGVEDDSVDAAQVAVSEIVTNALVHAGTEMRLRVLLAGTGLRVELKDGSPHLPRRRDYSTVAATGRGLHMVSQVVDKWGAYPDGEGKVVWFEIVDEDPAPDGSDVDPGRPRRTDHLEVELLNVPLLMHAAWQEHAAALLREMLLMRLEEDLSALEEHAALSDALSVLFEQIPAPDLGDHPDQIMGSATEPGVSLPRLVLRVPRGSLPHFRKLEQSLEEAVELAELGELLSPPTQPEIQIMRQWLCGQVLAQAAGHSGIAWVSPTDTRTPDISGPLEWDPTEVNTSDRALLAADDTNRIVAASRSAIASLGYVDLAELVGQRLVSIIPLRYHQAHVAGFTLHLVNGRSPLLGNRVTVPVVRADGTEADTDLVIEATALPHGRRLFVAEFFS